jgi:cell division protein DivIC
MKNWFQNFIDEFHLLKFVSNKYTIVSVFFVIWMLFLDNYSYFDHRILDTEIEELESNKKYYQEEIAKDEKSIKNLNNLGQTEKYAREKYFMKKDSEDIYIIDIEEDRVKDSVEAAKQ